MRALRGLDELKMGRTFSLTIRQDVAQACRHVQGAELSPTSRALVAN